MKKDVVLLMGAGQIGMAIVRRVGAGKRIIIGDKKPENAAAIAKILTEPGFDALPVEADLSSRESIKNLIAAGDAQGEVANVAELLLGPQGSFITGADFLVDGGATAAFFYGEQ